MAVPRLHDARRAATQAYKAAWRAALAAGATAQQAAAQARRAASAISSRAQALARTTTRHYTTYTRTVYAASLRAAERYLQKKQKEITALVRSEIVLSLYAISKSVLYLKRLVDQLWKSRYWILKRVVALEERVAKLKKEEEKSWLQRIFGLKLAGIIAFFKEFPKKIVAFFRSPWSFLFEVLPFGNFIESITKGLEDYTGTEEELKKDFEELPTPYETFDTCAREITRVKPEEGPAILPIVDQTVEAFSRRSSQEMMAASRTWEALRKEILEKLAL